MSREVALTAGPALLLPLPLASVVLGPTAAVVAALFAMLLAVASSAGLRRV